MKSYLEQWTDQIFHHFRMSACLALKREDELAESHLKQIYEEDQPQ